MRWLYKLEHKVGRYAIRNLMLYIVIGQGIVFLFDFFVMGNGLSALLALDISKVLEGQVWRLISFVFVPMNASPIFIVFTLYFYYLIGTNLEQTWSAFQFNVFYLIGILGAIAAAFLTGYGTNSYINLSLFFAFAILFPDVQVMLFFLLPIKIKWLALVNAVFYLYGLIFSSWSGRAAIIASLVNLIIFFGHDFIVKIRQNLKYRKTRQAYREQQREWKRNMNDRNRPPYS